MPNSSTHKLRHPALRKLKLFCNTQAFSAANVAIRGQVKGYLWAIGRSGQSAKAC